MSDFGKAAKDVQDLKDNLEKAAEVSLKSSMETVQSNLKHQLRANRSVATETLIDSIITVPAPLEDGRAFTGQKIMATDYWKYLEFGTGIYTSPGRGYKGPSPHAPVKPIYDWVQEKGINPDPEGPYDSQHELARAIAFDISTGTEQHMFIRPVWRGPFGRSLVINSVSKAMQSAVKRSF